MKKIVSIVLFIFWAAVAAIMTAGLVFYQNKDAGNPASGSLLPADSGGIILNAVEVSRHNSSAGCWMIINNKVYNFTDYLNIHPGGADTIIQYCGKDGTQGFDTKDSRKPQPHSASADSLLSAYYIGNLNQTIKASQITQDIQNPGIATPSDKKIKKDREYDDD